MPVFVPVEFWMPPVRAPGVLRGCTRLQCSQCHNWHVWATTRSVGALSRMNASDVVVPRFIEGHVPQWGHLGERVKGRLLRSSTPTRPSSMVRLALNRHVSQPHPAHSNELTGPHPWLAKDHRKWTRSGLEEEIWETLSGLPAARGADLFHKGKRPVDDVAVGRGQNVGTAFARNDRTVENVRVGPGGERGSAKQTVSERTNNGRSRARTQAAAGKQDMRGRKSPWVVACAACATLSKRQRKPMIE